MDLVLFLKTVVIGLVEGITEFLPISSTGHIILAEEVLHFEGPQGKVFEIVIQLGAILAVCVLYYAKIFATIGGVMRREPVALRFATSVIVAFLPAAVIGVALHKYIKALLDKPVVVAVAFIVGGIAILVIRRVAGGYLVDNLTASDTVRPAVRAFWTILSDGLAAAAWVVILLGVIGTLGAWLTGEGARAVSARRWLGPWMRNTGAAWAVFAVVLLLLVWALPLDRFLIAAIFVVLGAAGFEIARRQIVREYEAEGSPERRPLSVPWGKEKPPATEGSVDELERLAKLRSEDLLTEDEYAAAKGRLLPPAGS